ncbi:MAG: hypothetical protein H0T62_11060 [Parachlamydiaceae bacterium]|nr:hypothetical protein [Parachlamydiaceae bacterium]
MTILSSTYFSKIESLTLDEYRAIFDEICDYVPFVSTISNVIGVAQKHIYVSEMKINGTLEKSFYYTRLENKDFQSYWLLFIPLFNIMAAATLSAELATLVPPTLIFPVKFEDELSESTEDLLKDILDVKIEHKKLFKEELLGTPLYEISEMVPFLQSDNNLSPVQITPDEVMRTIYALFQSSDLIAFSRTCKKNLVSIQNYVELLSTRIRLLPDLGTFGIKSLAYQTYCCCLSSIFGDPTLKSLFNEAPIFKIALSDHLFSKSEIFFTNPQDIISYKQNRFIFFFEHGSDDQLFNLIHEEILSCEDSKSGLEFPDSINLHLLQKFFDIFLPLLTKERLLRFFPLFNEEKFGILPLFLIHLYLYLHQTELKIALPYTHTLIKYAKYLEKANEFFNIKEKNDKEALLLDGEIKEINTDSKKILDEYIVLYNMIKGIVGHLYKENPKSLLWHSKEIIPKYLKAEHVIHLLKKPLLIYDEKSLFDLSNQIAACFVKSTDKEVTPDFEQIFLEICDPKGDEEESIKKNKLIALVRALSTRKDFLHLTTKDLLDTIFNQINKYDFTLNLGFISPMIKEIFKNAFRNSSKNDRIFIFIHIDSENKINAFIDYCLDLPLNFQMLQLCAFRSFTFKNELINKVLVNRKLNPNAYPLLLLEAYQEAFSSLHH